MTFLFGPLGLFYSSAAAAIGCVLIAIVIGAMTFGVGAFAMWPVSILVGFATVHQFNAKVDLEARRHQELVAAVSGRTPTA